MHVFNIAGPGLSHQDLLILRSTLRFLDDGRCRWVCVDGDENADAVLRPLASVGAAPRQWLRLDLGAADVAPPANLMLPLRAHELAQRLRHAESALARRRNERLPRAGHRSLVVSMLSDSSPLGRARAMLRIGSLDELVIEAGPADGEVRQLRWRSWSMPDLATLCERIRLGAAVTLDFSPVSPADVPSVPPTCSGTLGQLIWALALNDPQPELDESLRRHVAFILTRWPAVNGMPSRGSQLRLTTLLARTAMSVQQLAARASVTEREAVAFVNACHWLGYLVVRSAAPPSPATPADAAARTASRLGGLIDSIRTALRGVVTKDAK